MGIIRENQKLTAKQRVLKALKKEPVDRVPVCLWMHPDTTKALMNYFELTQEQLQDLLFQDVRQIWVNNNYAMEGIVHEGDGEGHVDDWGIEWVKQHGFNQIKRSPFTNLQAKDITKKAFPYEKLDTLMQPMGALAQISNDYFLGCDVSPCAFELFSRLRGMEEALLDVILDPQGANQAITACLDFSFFLAEHALRTYQLDWLWTGDDIAGQQGMLMNPAIWRQMIKPGLQKVFSLAKEQGIPVAYHCCGALRPIIPDLIEIGLDVLHPIQPNCPGMDPESLKNEFGKNLAFIGGLDTQDLIPNAPSHIVRVETEKLVEVMTSDGGGYILAASHTVPPETPLKNIFAI